MLQTVLAFAIPTILTITAAFFLLRDVQKNEEKRRGPRFPQNQNDSAHSNDNRGPARTARRRKPSISYDLECAVCMEKKVLVELYPCGHKNFCADCINIIINDSKRLCPMCRRHIKGYSDH